MKNIKRFIFLFSKNGSKSTKRTLHKKLAQIAEHVHWVTV